MCEFSLCIFAIKNLDAAYTRQDKLKELWFILTFKDKNASMYIFVREFHIQPGDTFTVYNGARSDGVNVDKIVTLYGSVGLYTLIVTVVWILIEVMLLTSNKIWNDLKCN